MISMPNKYLTPVSPDTVFGEAIDHICKTRNPVMGSATLMQRDFLEKYKDEIIAFWNSQGRDGQKLYDNYHEKFSIGEDEQTKEKSKKKFEKKVKGFISAGMSREDAEYWASLNKEEIAEMKETLQVANHNQSIPQTQPQVNQEEIKKQERIDYLTRKIETDKKILENHPELKGTESYVRTETEIKELETELAKLKT